MMNGFTPSRILKTLILIFSITFAHAADFTGDAANGRKIWNANCASCHKLDKKLVGPALGDVTERRSTEWLLLWIRDNAALRASGDKDAIAVFNEYNGSVMTAFPALSDQDIYDILQFTIDGSKPVVPTSGGETAATTAAADAPNYLPAMLVVLSVLFILLISLLVKMKNTLRIVQGKDPQSVGQDVSAFGKALLANKFIVTIGTIVVAVLLINTVYWWLMGIGVEQNHEPEQPIAFSHEVHAGQNKVDCNYCHSSARHSKHSGIPSANVCMNCHKYIDGSEIKTAAGEPKYGGERSPEIAKIYASIGWDPEAGDYIPNYEQKPIKWIRIHNLPDLAYFNHAQHVTAGGVECQTCHGPVQEMEKVYQYSELTMGWCINCHRETEVNLSNEYYEGAHDKIKERYHTEKITAEMIGGLECGKCHY